MCDATHPEFGWKCWLNTSNHEEHGTFTDMDPLKPQVYWDNENYVKPVPRTKAGAATHLANLASQIPNQNTPGKMHSDPQATEDAAAWAVMPRTGTQRMRVLECLASHPDGLTDAEVADETGIYLYSAAPRRTELLGGGWVTDSGIRRETGHGGDGIVWVVTDKAREHFPL